MSNSIGFHKNTNLIPLAAVILAMSVLLGPRAVVAENRALLIGVGSYPKMCGTQQDCYLPGIDVDMKSMRRVVSYMGYEAGQVRTIQDREATYKGVKTAFQDWLFEGVTPADRVFIYFSGHGTHVPDENGDEGEGNPDTALVMHDSAVVQDKGREMVVNALIDDEFGQWLARIPSTNIFVIVDACHSGDTYKALLGNRRLGEAEGKYKYLRYSGMPQPRMRKKKGFLASRSISRTNYVAISAAQDDEKSIATPKGSVFTLGVDSALGEAVRNQAQLTIQDLLEKTQEYVKQNTSALERFHPQLRGNPDLAEQILQLVPQNQGRGTTWSMLESVVDQSTESLELKPLRGSYKLGDQSIAFDLEIPWGGFLNVVAVGPDDQATVLFPNGYSHNNKVQPGTLKLPNREKGQEGYRYEAQKPTGPTLVVATLSTDPVDLYEASTNARNIAGVLTETYGGFSTKGLVLLEKTAARSIGVVGEKAPSKSKMAAGKTIVTIE